ncbi:MAG TPA: APC family permease [Nevskiaceae bacterium]|nr:APC family permease [Nevskiaceae bacterium]
MHNARPRRPWNAVINDKVRQFLFGKKLDPLNPSTRGHIALVAFLAWIGLGADGLSSACYGPEEAFLALGVHMHLALYLALATAGTVFVISLAYNQVIELFPSGGGGYKAATKLVGPNAGLVSGSALIVDYVLTIAISAASGVDALFSLLPVGALHWKLPAEFFVVVALILLNLRGMKESIYVLMPVFLGFFISHLLLIVYGIGAHADRIGGLLPQTIAETQHLSGQMGWVFVVSLFLKAYSVGAGTYTGIEAVSNNVNSLAEPRVRTGHWTMFYMATSLAFTAGGIILLYLLWQAHPEDGKTLNAVVFAAIIEHAGWHSPTLSHGALAATMLLEAGLLMVASNTGFLGGPAVMASMAADRWVPRQFRQLSDRMVTQNGILVMGVAALAILLITRGAVAVLVVLYSINVFLTFTLSLYGLTRYWWTQRLYALHWRGKFLLSGFGLAVTSSILLVILTEKFTQGGWVTLVITGVVIGICWLIRGHYDETARAMKRIDQLYELKNTWGDDTQPLPVDPAARTAVFLVGGSRGAGMHALQWVLKTFAGQFQNFVFVSVGEVDKQSFDTQRNIQHLQTRIDNSLHYFTSYCASRGLAATSFRAFGADPLDELTHLLTTQVLKDFPNAVCFASKLIFRNENALTRVLHNQMPLSVQQRLQLVGYELIIVPIELPQT